MHKHNPLCVTPLHREFESWLGYVLRISAANALPSPMMMLSHYGWESVSMKNLPIEMLSSLTGRSISTYSKIFPTDSTGIDQLSSHKIGREFHNPVTPKVCTICIKENGFIDARWDLYHYIVCDKHKIWLVDKCSDCNKPLKWNRPDLNICSCKSEISPSTNLNVPDDLCELSQLISAVFEGRSLQNTVSSLNMPFESFSRMSLHTLIKVLNDMAASAIHVKRELTGKNLEASQKSICIQAARLLSNWPNNFYNFLSADAKLSSSKDLNVVKRNSFLFNLLFKGQYPEHEVSYLFKCFVLYAKIKNVPFELEDLEADFYGFQRLKNLTTKELVGELDLKMENLLGEYTVAEASVTPEIPIAKPISHWDSIEQETLNDNSQIAKTLKLPLRVVNSIMADKSENAIYKDFSFRINIEYGRKRFEKTLRDRCSGMLITEKIKLISYKKLVKYSYSKGVVEVIKALLNREISAYYDPEDEQIYFNESEVNNFFEFEDVIVSDALTIKSVARILDCSSSTVFEYASNGLIQIIPNKDGHFIRNADVENFNNQYLTIRNLAKSLNRSSRETIKICRDHEIKFVTNPKGMNLKPFIIWKNEYKKIEKLNLH